VGPQSFTTFLDENFPAAETTAFILEWNGNYELQDYDSVLNDIA